MSRTRVSLFLAVGFLWTAHAFAQAGAETPAFTFGGTSTLATQYATRQGSNQGIPSKYVRWDFDPLIGLYGVPLSAHVFLASETNDAGNTINSFGITFSMSPQRLQEFLLQRVRDRIAPAGLQDNIDKIRDLDSLRAVVNSPGCAQIQQQLAEAEARRARDTTKSADSSAALDALRATARSCEQAQTALAAAEKAKAAVDAAEQLRREVADKGIESIKDPSKLRSALGEIGMLSGVENFMLNFVTFGIGQTYPNYTPLTVTGVPVNGFDIEFNPGSFYLAVANGGAQAPALASRLGIMQYGRQLQAGRIGYGQKFGSHLIFTIVHAKDDGSSVPPDSIVLRDSLGLFPTPQENLVLGADARVSLLDDHLALQAELDGSALTGDTRASDLENSSIPSELSGLITPKLSSFVDYAYLASVGYNDLEAGTRVNAEVRRIGPGYFSLGAPNLRNDLFRISGKFDQTLFARQLSLSFSVRNEHDNVISWKSSTTTLSGYTAGVGLSLHHLPSLRVQYGITTQLNDATLDSLIINNVITTMMVSSGYSYPIGRLTSSTSVTYISQNGTSHQSVGDFNIQTVMLTEMLAFRIPLSLAGSISYSNRLAQSDTGIMRAIDLSATLTSFETWQNTLGLGVMSESNHGTRTGIYVMTQLPIITNALFFSMRVERNVFAASSNALAAAAAVGPDGVPANPLLAGDYSEWLVRASISCRW